MNERDLRDQLQQTLGSAFTIERELSGGGMSRVFLAEDTALQRKVVIKVLPEDAAGHVSVGRFKREISLAAQLQHPHIVPLLTAGETSGLPFFTMPYVRGDSLRARLDHGRMPIVEAVRVLREVASALAFAHEQGVVHRDIKPDNVLVSSGSAMVTDFGVAKALSIATDTTRPPAAGITSLGVALGTPAYMSPEQASADPNVDHRADIYAWGVLAYELLAGSTPFAGRSPSAMLAAQIGAAPEPLANRRPGIPPPLADLVMCCLAKQPEDRPQTAGEIVRALDAIVTPSGGSPPAKAGGVWRRSPVQLSIAAALGLVVVGGLWFAAARRGTDSVRTIAVVPVIVEGVNADQQYVSDGIADDITSALLQVKTLSVINRSSANAFKAKTIDTRAAARALGVDHVLELTVRPSGAGIRVNADMVTADNGIVRWSRAFQSDRQAMTGLGDRIADSLIAQLSGAGKAPSLRKRHQPSPEAFEAYQRELFFVARFNGKQDFDSTMVYFARAIAADSLYAEPYAAAASMYLNASDNFGLRLPVAYAKADTLSRRALALDSLNGEAYSDAGWIEVVLHWDWQGAKRSLDRAIALDPSNAIAHVNYSVYLDTHGDPLPPSIEEDRLALHLDPYNAFAGWHLVLLYVAANQPDSALAAWRQLQGVSPGFFELEDPAGDAYLEKNQPDSALAVALAASKRQGWPTSGLVVAYAALGRKADAERTYREILAASKTHLVLNEVVGRAALAAGHHDEAIAWLEKATAERCDFGLEIRYLPDMRPLMRDPAYIRLLGRMGILHP